MKYVERFVSYLKLLKNSLLLLCCCKNCCVKPKSFEFNKGLSFFRELHKMFWIAFFILLLMKNLANYMTNHLIFNIRFLIFFILLIYYILCCIQTAMYQVCAYLILLSYFKVLYSVAQNSFHFFFQIWLTFSSIWWQLICRLF